MSAGIASSVEQLLGRSRIPASAKPRDPLAWVAEQALRTDAAVDEGCAEVCVSGDAKRTKL